MREVDYQHNLTPNGGMSFRLSLPLGTHNTTERPCADGQFGNILKLYRDWKLSGDDAWLRKLWPAAKASLDYAWSPDNPDLWDPDQTGVLWGRQHHTLDMELFGPNSWLTGFYLGALKAGSEMAAALGDNKSAELYAAIYAKGRAWVDANLFNGEYFIQKIDLGDKSILKPFADTEVQAGVLGDGVETLYWSPEHRELKYQYGDGCLIDQVLGQWHAALYGLGDILDETKTKTALGAIYRHNFVRNLGDIYNPCRVFGMDDESGTVVATWPNGARKPAVPVPYAQETMHGMEYAFGQMLIQYGRVREGIDVIAGVRDRYDGAKRNPWNEIECGSNYARSMASWGGMIVMAGFSVDAGLGHLGFAPKIQHAGRFASVWSGANAYGTIEMHSGQATLTVLGGELVLSSLGLPLHGGEATAATVNGKAVAFGSDEENRVAFDGIRLGPGDSLDVTAPSLGLLDLPDLDTLDRVAVA